MFCFKLRSIGNSRGWFLQIQKDIFIYNYIFIFIFIFIFILLYILFIDEKQFYFSLSYVKSVDSQVDTGNTQAICHSILSL